MTLKEGLEKEYKRARGVTPKRKKTTVGWTSVNYPAYFKYLKRRNGKELNVSPIYKHRNKHEYLVRVKVTIEET